MTRPRLLYFLHNFHNRAGTEEHVKTLAGELKAEFEIAFVFPSQGEVILRYHDTEEEKSFGGEMVVGPFFNQSLPKINDSIVSALSVFSPDLIHIHHLFNWPMNCIETVLNYAKENQKRTLLTFHDYFFITPVFTMQGVNTVKEALSEKYSIAVFRKDIRAFLTSRIEYFKEQFKRVDYFLTPSKFAASAIEEIFNINCNVLTHGIPSFNALEREPGKLRFGYVGSLLPQKGWRELLNAWSVANIPNAELHLYGGSEVPSALPLNAVYHGVYNQKELPKILSNIDIGIIPSVFPETFSLVLSEMQMAGLPVIATTFGALPERIKPKSGWTVNPYNTANFATLLESIASNQSWRDWKIPKPKLSSEMAKEYSTLYRRLL